MYVQDEGVTVADSGFIRLHIERKYACDFDATLTVEQRAAAWAIERMCEDHLYFAMLETRWMDEGNFAAGVGTMFGVIPFPLRGLAKIVLRRMNARRLAGHGLGRHTKIDIATLALRDVDSLAALLGAKPYLMGDTPCGADATVFGIVTSILTPPLNDPVRAAMQRHDNLVDYRDRLTRRWFSS